MNRIEKLDVLPGPIKYATELMYNTDGIFPLVVEATEQEMNDLAEDQDLLFQLLFDRKYDRWYFVAVGDKERTIQSDMVYHQPIVVRRSIIAFCPVTEAWIRNTRRRFESRMLGQSQEYVEDEHGPRWV